MIKKSLFGLLFLFSFTAFANDYNELKLRSTYKYSFLFFDVYKIDLFLPESIDAQGALSDIPKKIVIDYYMNISGKRIMKKSNQSLAENPEFSAEKFKKELDTINQYYSEVKDGDQYIISYTPGVGTELFFNQKKLTTIPGYEFSRYYFGIWLSEYAFSQTAYRELILKR